MAGNGIKICCICFFKCKLTRTKNFMHTLFLIFHTHILTNTHHHCRPNMIKGAMLKKYDTYLTAYSNKLLVKQSKCKSYSQMTLCLWMGKVTEKDMSVGSSGPTKLCDEEDRLCKNVSFNFSLGQ